MHVRPRNLISFARAHGKGYLVILKCFQRCAACLDVCSRFVEVLRAPIFSVLCPFLCLEVLREPSFIHTLSCKIFALSQYAFFLVLICLSEFLKCPPGTSARTFHITMFDHLLSVCRVGLCLTVLTPNRVFALCLDVRDANQPGECRLSGSHWCVLI